ncbi:MAG: hypothetical protein AB1428_13120 [Bacteroidota bacterium]
MPTQQDIPVALKIDIIERELNGYLQARYQLELRRRVAERAKDDRLKESVTADLVKVEAAIDQLTEELEALRAKNEKPN